MKIPETTEQPVMTEASVVKQESVTSAEPETVEKPSVGLNTKGVMEAETPESKEMEPVRSKIEIEPEEMTAPLDSNPKEVDPSHMSLAEIIKLNKLKMKKQPPQGLKDPQGLKGTQGGRVKKKPKKKKAKKQNAKQQQKNPNQQPQQKKQKQNPNQQQKQLAHQGWPGPINQKQSLSVNQTSAISTLPSGPGKIVIKNLDIGVTDQDIYDLFSECGEIIDASVHYNRVGKSLGSAHVSFKRYVDAVKGQRKYHGVTLDGRAMIIDVENICDLEQEQNIYANAAVPTRGNRKKSVKRLQRGPLAPKVYSQYVRPLASQQSVAIPRNAEMGYGISSQFSMGYADPGYGLNLHHVKSKKLFGSHLECTSIFSRVTLNAKSRLTHCGFKNELQYPFLNNLGDVGLNTEDIDTGDIGGQWMGEGTSLVGGNQQQYGIKKKSNQQRKKKRKKQQQQQAQSIQKQVGSAQKGNQPKSSKKKKKQQKANALTAEQLDKEMDDYLKTIHVN